MIILLSFIMALSLLYCFFIHFFCMKKETVSRSARIYLLISLAGVLLLVLALIIYYVRLGTFHNKELAPVLATVFEAFIWPVGILTAVILAFSVISHFARQRLSPVIPYICHLASLLILLWTTIYSSWSHYEEFEITLYLGMCGAALGLILLFPSHLTFSRFAERFNDKEFMKRRKYGDPERLKRKKEKEHIKETRQRIKGKSKNKS